MRKGDYLAMTFCFSAVNSVTWVIVPSLWPDSLLISGRTDNYLRCWRQPERRGCRMLVREGQEKALGIC